VIVVPPTLAPQTGRLLDDRFRPSFNLAAVPPVRPTVVVAPMTYLCWLGERLLSTDEIHMTGSAQAAVNQLISATNVLKTVSRPKLSGNAPRRRATAVGSCSWAAETAVLAQDLPFAWTGTGVNTRVAPVWLGRLTRERT
jgi:hypothetical protein